MRAPLPLPRGPLSQQLLTHLTAGRALPVPKAVTVDARTDDDLHLALWCCYQLHHGGFHDVDDDAEWDLGVLAFRRVLEDAFEAALRSEHRPAGLPADPVTALRVVAEWSGPPLARTLAAATDRNRLEEFAIHRSAYQLKEADGHTWGIPRLGGPGRAAMIEIQADEYGGGRPGESHAELFAGALEELGVDATYGAHIDALPGATLATDNLVSLFGLHHRLRGALVGHLALFEMCSTWPMSQYLLAARRHGGLPRLARFYEVHVEVDAHHGRLALDEMVAPMVAADPAIAADVVFGAVALSHVESRFARHLLRSWDHGISSLRRTPQAAGLLGAAG